MWHRVRQMPSLRRGIIEKEIYYVDGLCARPFCYGRTATLRLEGYNIPGGLIAAGGGSHLLGLYGTER
jgi:hypothetical protein